MYINVSYFERYVCIIICTYVHTESRLKIRDCDTLSTSNSSSKTRGAAAPPHSNYLGVFPRFRRTFAKVITFGEASAHEF